jgi:hypothetical protein
VPQVPGTPGFPPTDKQALASAGLKHGTALIFVKVFDVATQTLRVVGHLHVDPSSAVKDALPAVCAVAGFPPETKLKVYEEVRAILLLS